MEIFQFSTKYAVNFELKLIQSCGENDLNNPTKCISNSLVFRLR